MSNGISPNLSKYNNFLNSSDRLIETIGSTSIFILFLKKLRKRNHSFKLWLDRVLKESQIHKPINTLQREIKFSFRYSFLGRISEIKKEDNLIILDESKGIRYLSGLYKTSKDRWANYLIGSEAVNLVKGFKKEFYLLPVKIGSIAIITGILTNILFLVLFNREIGIFSLTIQLLLFLIGLNGLRSNVTWEDIKKTSFLINYINNYCKI